MEISKIYFAIIDLDLQLKAEYSFSDFVWLKYFLAFIPPVQNLL